MLRLFEITLKKEGNFYGIRVVTSSEEMSEFHYKQSLKPCGYELVKIVKLPIMEGSVYIVSDTKCYDVHITE